jgi:hypothetical protein
MEATTRWETFKADREQIVGKLKKLVYEGNVRRVLVQHEGRTIAEFPLTAGVVGLVLAPVLAAVGVLVAMMEDCTIKVERTQPATGDNAGRHQAA